VKSNECVRFGLIGPGKAASQFLAPALEQAQGARLWSVHGPNATRTLEFARKHGAESPRKAFVNVDEFLGDSELEAVLIATPDSTHADYITAALQSGKPVFVEKPMCATVSEGLRIADAALKLRIPVGVGYQLRHHLGLKQMIAQIHSGVIGTPHHMRVQWTYRSPQGAAHWRSTKASAPWWSLGSFGTHCLDLIRWALLPLCGEIVNVRSLITTAVWRAENDETAIAALQFASGATAELTTSVLFQSETRVEVFGDRGAAVAEDALDTLGGGRFRLLGTEVAVQSPNPYVAEMEHFADCVRFRRTPVVDVLEGLRNVQLLEQIAGGGINNNNDTIV